MPWYTGLARVARTTGFPVVETVGWKANGHRAMSGCQAIIVHHTATTNTTANAPTLDYVRRNKLSHYVLGRDGTIYVTGAGFQGHAGRDSLVSPAHARNRTSIGIEAENTGRGEPWSDVQMESYVRLVRALIDEFRLSVSRVYGHKEIALTERGTLGRKVDPTFNMSTFRAAVQRGTWATKPTPAPAPETTPKPTPAPTKPKEWTDMATEAQVEAAGRKGALKALPEDKVVSWRDSTTGETKKFSVSEALGYLSVHWNREVQRDAEALAPGSPAEQGEPEDDHDAPKEA